jgi:CNT family concentrative nucleoside transporter
MIQLFSSSLLTPAIKRIIGIVVVFIISYAMSNEKKKIAWKNIFIMFGSIWVLAYIFFRLRAGVLILNTIASLFEMLYRSADVGIEFLFGKLSNPSLAWGFIFAFKILPVIIFFSALISIAYYVGVIQYIVERVGWLVRPLFGTSGPETLCAVANSFLAQTEAPMLIKTYLKDMSQSEIFVVMVSGMGTISAGILAVYASMGIPIQHLLISSIISVPATIMIAKLWFPDKSVKIEKCAAVKEKIAYNILDACSKGASEGLYLALNVGAMLLVTLSIIGILNGIIEYISYVFNFSHIYSFKDIFSCIAYPCAWVLGVPDSEIASVAQLIGAKVAINEMIAYSSLVQQSLSPYTVAITTYALCGFSNFSCIGIQLGGIGAMEQSTRSTISSLGVYAVFAAALSNILTACIAGFFI